MHIKLTPANVFFSVKLLKMEMERFLPLPNTMKRTITEEVTTKDSVTKRTIVEDVEPANPLPNQEDVESSSDGMEVFGDVSFIINI